MKNLIENKLKEIEYLCSWENLNVLPEVEEKPEDIWLLIKYDDHGDDFLVVGTRDGKLYQYALYENMKYSECYHYVRAPKLYKGLDYYANVSNAIFFELERLFQKSHMSFGYDLKLRDKTEAQRRFKQAIDYIVNMSETATEFFDYERKKVDIKCWLELNEIDTEDNLKILSETAFHNKEGKNRIVGIAGKTDITGREWLSGDDFKLVCVNNKELDPEKVTVEGEYDEWGVVSYGLPIKGFIPSKK